MAMIQCPECGRDVSDRAPNCIHCGCPLAAPKSELIIQVKDKRRRVAFFFYDSNEFFDEIHAGETKHYEVTKPLKLVVGHNRHSFVGSAIRDSLPVNVVPGRVTKLVAALAAWDIPMHYVLKEVDVIE